MDELSPFTDATAWLEDRQRLHELARSEGYICLRGVVNTDTVMALRHRVLDACAERGWLDQDALPSAAKAGPATPGLAYDDPAYVELLSRIFVLAEFAALRKTPALLKVLQVLLQAPPRAGVGDCLRLSFPANEHLTTGPHQDRHYVKEEHFWTVWIPLGDCPLELGPLALWPGSHRLGLLHHAAEDHAPEQAGRYSIQPPEGAVWVSDDLACGDALLFHGLTVHRACPNRSRDRLRLSVDYRYTLAYGQSPSP